MSYDCGEAEDDFGMVKRQPTPSPAPASGAETDSYCKCGHRKADHTFAIAPPDSPDPHYHGGGVCYGCAHLGKAYMCGGFCASGAS